MKDEHELVAEVLNRFADANGRKASVMGVHRTMKEFVPYVAIEIDNQVYEIGEHTLGDIEGDSNVEEVKHWIRQG